MPQQGTATDAWPPKQVLISYEYSCSCAVVRLYLLQVGRAGSCPYRPAEKHVHNDAFSNYGAGGCIRLVSGLHGVTQKTV